MAIGTSAADAFNDACTKLSGGNSGAPEVKHRIIDDRVAGALDVTVSGKLHSAAYNNGIPGEMTAPGASPAVNPTNATNGSLKQTDAAGGLTKWLTGAAFTAQCAGGLDVVLYDRLAHVGGLDGTSAGTQSVSSLADTRTGSDYINNEILIEIIALIGATGRTITFTYTNENSTGGRVTPAIIFGGTGFREAGAMIAVPLQAGDLGVKSVESCIISASTGTVGNFGIVLASTIDVYPIALSGGSVAKNYLNEWGPPPKIFPGACLMNYYSIAGAVPPRILSHYAFVDG